MKIHPSSIIGDKVKIAEDVEIGAFCVIEGDVSIGKGTKIGNRVTIKGRTTIGEGCKIYEGAVIGEEPQHLQYKGEDSEVIIGNNVLIREFVTIHRGTHIDKMKTIIGDDVMLMAYSHVAHDCVIGKGVIMANCVTLGGHVEVGDYAFLGGLAGVHQWARVGAYAIVSAMGGVSMDIPPYAKAAKQPAVLFGINLVGLRRRGFSNERIKKIKKAYNTLFRSNLTKEKAIEQIKEEFGEDEDVKLLIDFIQSSKRGVARDVGRDDLEL